MVDKIDSKAMETAVLEGQTPFALFKPAKGIPVLVRISPGQNSKHVNILNTLTFQQINILTPCKKDKINSIEFYQNNYKKFL